jgi:hypothetical protein
MNYNKAMVGAAGVIALALSSGSWTADAGCDRACLRVLLDRYLEAVVKHDAGAAPLTPGFRQTENAVAVRRGDGAWKTISALGKLQRRYLDPVNQSAGYYGTIQEGADASVATLRLQIVNRKITEAEWVIGRKDTGTPTANGPGSTSAVGAEMSPPPEAALAREQRIARADMIALANGYFDSLQSGDTQLFIAHPGWVRTENGIGTGEGPGGGMRGGGPGLYQGRSGGSGPPPAAAAAVPTCSSICAVVARRYPVVDEEAGVVLGMVIFLRPPGNASRRNLLTEWFAIDSGKVRGIYAAMHYLPPTIGAPNWPPYDGNWPLSFPSAGPAQ